jgi:CheY-like chemotaxis protein
MQNDRAERPPHASPQKPSDASFRKESSAGPRSSWSGETAKVLIVDDRPENLLALQVILEDLEEIELVTSGSGAEALELIASHDFGVILLDVNMPGVDGFETARLIRQNENSVRTPIIFLTAFADALHEIEAYSHGAVDFIETPVIPFILRAKVRMFADYFRIRKELQQQRQQQAGPS